MVFRLEGEERERAHLQNVLIALISPAPPWHRLNEHLLRNRHDGGRRRTGRTFLEASARPIVLLPCESAGPRDRFRHRFSGFLVFGIAHHPATFQSKSEPVASAMFRMGDSLTEAFVATGGIGPLLTPDVCVEISRLQLPKSSLSSDTDFPFVQFCRLGGSH